MKINRWNNNRIKYIHYSYGDFYDYDTFVMKLLEILKENVQYSLLLKVNYNDVLYGMVGKQIGFNYSSEDTYDIFEQLHQDYNDRLKHFFDDYSIEKVNSIQLLCVTIDDIPELKLKNVNKVPFNKEFTKVIDSKERFNIIPLTMNTNYFGKLVKIDYESYLKKINNQRSILNQDSISLDDVDSMFLYNKYIIISKEYNKNIYRSIYSSVSGRLVNELVDTPLSNNSFIRKIGNINLTILNDNIVKVESEKVLSAIRYRAKSLKDESNQLIGSWDIEAFEEDGYAKVYALGFTVLNKLPSVYYLNKNITSEELVLKCINDMLTNEYNGYTFYTHNFGRYDSVFLLKILKEENIKKGEEYYKLDSICRDKNILKLRIKVKRSLSDRKPNKIGARKDPGFNVITIVDSLNLLNQSLDKLCHSFNVEVTKGKFPHSFVKRDTLNYIGSTPKYEYWNDIELSEYNSLVKSDWNLKEECLIYLEKDLVSLTLIMNKFSEYINRKYHLQVTDSLTISRLALNIFLKEYLKDTKLPMISKNMFSDIKQGYYGGVTEVYKPYGRNLFYYDVNSLYPFAALNSMPGTTCKFIENLSGDLEIDNLFGFFYCDIETTDNYLGLLPLHVKEGLIMPNGKWTGWYFSEELKFAKEKGYTIKVIKGYNFNKIDNVFTEYVNDLYEIKSTTKDKVERDIIKRLLNHLLGRFGMNIFKPITEIVDEAKLSLIWSTRQVLGDSKRITESDYWLTYNPTIDKNICEEHNMDYIKVCNLTSKVDSEKQDVFEDVSITTAAAVTAYARIYMSKIKLDILDNGGNIYYTDTDSIVTDIILDDKLVGNKLGQFKLEHKISEGYFISNKTYCLVVAKEGNNVNDLIIKSKTVTSNSLSLDSFKELYKGSNTKAIKRFAVTDHNKGSVLICEDKVNLKHDSYTKREKIFKRYKWVDTKPLILNSSIISNKLNIKKYILKSNKTILKYISYFNNINKYLKYIFYYINKIINFMICLGIFLLATVMYTTNNEVIDYELELLLESRYNDDYMEEPIDIELFKDISYLDKLLDYFNNLINLFSQENYQSYNLHRYLYKINKENVVDNLNYEIHKNVIEYSVHNRPQVLVDVLINHINAAQEKVNKLNDVLSISEVSRIKRDNLVWDALSMCKKALEGQPYDSPILGYNSPVVTQNSSLYEGGSSFRGSNSNTSQISIINKTLVNNITTIINSSYIGTNSPVMDNSRSMSNTPITKGVSFLSKNNSPILSDRNLGVLNTPVMDDNSKFTSKMQSGLGIDTEKIFY